MGSTNGIDKRQFALVLLALFSLEAEGFAPPRQAVTRSSTRRNVGKWQIPFLKEEQATAEAKTIVAEQDESPLANAFSTFFPGDTTQNSEESMGDLVEMMGKEKESNYAPLVGAVAVALAVGATATGVV